VRHTTLEFTVPYYNLSFVYIACSSLEGGVYLYSEGRVDEGEKIGEKGENKNTTMLGCDDGVYISFLNGLQYILGQKVSDAW